LCLLLFSPEGQQVSAPHPSANLINKKNNHRIGDVVTTSIASFIHGILLFFLSSIFLYTHSPIFFLAPLFFFPFTLLHLLYSNA
jgi:hypothetical protein